MIYERIINAAEEKEQNENKVLSGTAYTLLQTTTLPRSNVDLALVAFEICGCFLAASCFQMQVVDLKNFPKKAENMNLNDHGKGRNSQNLKKNYCNFFLPAHC